jgi:subtilase family serine protease
MDAPLVLSCSFFMVFENNAPQGPIATLEEIDRRLKYLGLLGTTVVVASGDNGFNHRFAQCASETSGPSQTTYPQGSPYVLNVGATIIDEAEDLGDSLKGCDFWAAEGFRCIGKGVEKPLTQGQEFGFSGVVTGSGFCNVDTCNNASTQASWQSEMVTEYLDQMTSTTFDSNAYKATVPPASTYNAKGRAFPDIVAAGYMLPIIGQVAELGAESGSSASAPIVAGALATLATETPKGYLGFVNPMLYKWKADSSRSSVFNRVEGEGSWNNYRNRNMIWSGKGDAHCPHGMPWIDTKWNPLSGLGSLNFGVMRSLLKERHTIPTTSAPLLV